MLHSDLRFRVVQQDLLYVVFFRVASIWKHGKETKTNTQAPRFQMQVRGSCVSYLMPWEDIIRELRQNCLETDIFDVPRKQDCLNYVMRVHLKVAGHNLEKHIRQLKVRPFVLLLLLDYLIAQGHSVFKDKGSPQVLRSKVLKIVER